MRVYWLHFLSDYEFTLSILENRVDFIFVCSLWCTHEENVNTINILRPSVDFKQLAPENIA